MTLSIPEISADADNLEAALAYAGAGLYVGPARRKSKHPGSLLGDGWQTQTSSDPDQIAAWFAATNSSVFIHAGRSGLVIFDVDYVDKVPKVLAKHLPSAPHQSSRPDSPGRGHYLFAQPVDRMIGNGTGKLGSTWGQVRGTNGVVMVAPSVHEEGGEYRWLRTGVIPVLPADLAEKLPDGAPGESSATDAEVLAFTAAHTTASRPGVLDGRVKGFAAALAAGNGRHDSTVPFLRGAIEEAAAGLYSAQAAIDALKPIFTGAVTVGAKKRSQTQAENEFGGLLAWAVAQASTANLEEVRARVSTAMPDFDEILRNSVKIKPSPGKTKPKEATPRVWRSTELADSAPLEWLGVSHIPEAAVTLLTGDEGIGKSLLWVHIVAAVTTGSALPEFGIPGREARHVLVVVTEDDWSSTVRPRLELAGADMGYVSVLCSEPDGSGSPYFPRDIGIVASTVPPPYLIVLDAWADTVEGHLSIKDGQQARQALHPWKEIATKLRAAVLLLTHTNRGNGDNIRERYALTSELRKKARMALFAQRDEDGNLVVGPDKSNLVGKVPASVFTIEAVEVFEPTESSDGTVPRLKFLRVSRSTAAELLIEISGPPVREGAQGFAAVTLAVILGDLKPHPRIDVIEQCANAGIAERTAERAADDLGVLKERSGFPSTSTWRLAVSPPVRPSVERGGTGATEVKTGATRDPTTALPLADSDADPPVPPITPPVTPVPPTNTDGPTVGRTAAVEKSSRKAWPLCAAGCGQSVNPIYGDTHSVCVP